MEDVHDEQSRHATPGMPVTSRWSVIALALVLGCGPSSWTYPGGTVVQLGKKEPANCQSGDDCMCESHEDCTEGLDGVCVRKNMSMGAWQPDTLVCFYSECAQDADCGAGKVCVPARAPHNPTAYCVRADCHSDSDCSIEPGGQCQWFDRLGSHLSTARYPAAVCTYPSDPCSLERSCPEDYLCVPGDARVYCRHHPPEPLLP